MEGDPVGEQLRADARAYLAGDESGLGRFVGGALPLIDAGIRAGLLRAEQWHDGWQKVDPTEAANRFLDAKLLESADGGRGPTRFLERLIGAEDAGRVLVASASNFTIDLLRTRTDGDISMGRAAQSERGQPSGVADLGDPSRGLEDELVEHQTTRELRADLDGLSPSDRAVLGVLLPAAWSLEPGDLAAIAERRGVGTSVVRAELSRREDAWFARQSSLQRARAARGAERWAIVRKLKSVEKLAAQLGDPQDTRPAKGVLLTDFESLTALRAATPEIRAAVMERRRAMIQQKDAALAELSRHLANPSLADPNYEEVAIILGRIQAHAPEAERKRAANSVNAAWLRARKRLIAARRARGDEP